MLTYQEDLLARYWAYQQRCFPHFTDYFDPKYVRPASPPVFYAHQAWWNVLCDPAANEQERARVLALVPTHERHKWFRSMNSSQALAQSVLGNLAVHEYLDCLADLLDDSGQPLMGEAAVSAETFRMEHKVNHLGEPRPTSLDGFIAGDYQVAIECKFTEPEFGTCSRPRLAPTDTCYADQGCDGTFTHQLGRTHRCPLSAIGVKYWEFVPELFRWRNDSNLSPCPLNKTYQLMRNVLATGVRPTGDLKPEGGHVVVIYDARNPAFQRGGSAITAYADTRVALKDPTRLRKCSWQHIIGHLRSRKILPWLTESLLIKYGL